MVWEWSWHDDLWTDDEDEEVVEEWYNDDPWTYWNPWAEVE